MQDGKSNICEVFRSPFSMNVGASSKGTDDFVEDSPVQIKKCQTTGSVERQGGDARDVHVRPYCQRKYGQYTLMRTGDDKAFGL